jgi:uncharacterized heparinase superfamily protein
LIISGVRSQGKGDAFVISRYFHTLRYLKPVQIYGRVWFRLHQPRPDTSPAPNPRNPRGIWHPPCPKPESINNDNNAGLTPTFLNETHIVQSPEDWNNPAWEKLWLYNLHYFDDLGCRGAEGKRALHQGLIRRWIRENPPGAGNGWEPYPISLRLVNWIKWGLAGDGLEDDVVHSLAVQARYLFRRLEFHLLGNHLLANAKALVFAGLFFQGKEADAWLEKGAKILAAQIPAQVLEDGGHFELSPMYHAIVLEDLLDLVNVTRAYARGHDLAELCGKHIPGMVAWLDAMCHPDGQIAFFNDAALGIAAAPGDLKDYAGRLGFLQAGRAKQAVAPIPESGVTQLSESGVTHLPESGYVRVQAGPVLLLADVGRIGPDYLPGHAHADTLSFELSVSGRRVLVNSGISCYGASAERLAQRGTPAHNTVCVDGKNSSEVWGGFRVARRAYPQDLCIDELPEDRVQIQCCHDGYVRQGGGPLHCRKWILSHDRLEITDTLLNPGHHMAVYYHLSPGAAVDLEEHVIFLENLRINFSTDAHCTLTDTLYHPEFGRSIPNKCLILTPAGQTSTITFFFGVTH